MSTTNPTDNRKARETGSLKKAGAITLAVVGAMSGLMFAFGGGSAGAEPSADAAPVVVTEYVDANGEPIDPAQLLVAQPATTPTGVPSGAADSELVENGDYEDHADEAAEYEAEDYDEESDDEPEEAEEHDDGQPEDDDEHEAEDDDYEDDDQEESVDD